jgi:hypothetical protein
MRLLCLIFCIFAQPVAAVTCSLSEIQKQNEVHGLDYSYRFQTVLVQTSGILRPGDFTVKRISISDKVMPWCYEIRGEWRCGSIPDLQTSKMLKAAKVEAHASAKFYLYDGDVIITYSEAWVDNARAPSNQVSFLNDVLYFRGRYTCK